MNERAAAAAVELADLLRQRCICLEEDGALVCECPMPISRAQVGRLRAFAALHPDRAVAYSELVDEWVSVLHAFLPKSDDPVLAWLQAPLDVPTSAELRHATGLDALLDDLGAPPTALLC